MGGRLKGNQILRCCDSGEESGSDEQSFCKWGLWKGERKQTERGGSDRRMRDGQERRFGREMQSEVAGKERRGSNFSHAVLALERLVSLQVAQHLRVDGQCALASDVRVARAVGRRELCYLLDVVAHRLQEFGATQSQSRERREGKRLAKGRVVGTHDHLGSVHRSGLHLERSTLAGPIRRKRVHADAVLELDRDVRHVVVLGRRRSRRRRFRQRSRHWPARTARLAVRDRVLAQRLPLVVPRLDLLELLLSSDFVVVGALIEEGRVDLHEELEGVVDHAVDGAAGRKQEASQRQIEI